MNRLISSLVLFSGLASAQQFQQQYGLPFFLAQNATNAQTTTNTWIAQQWYPTAACTISKIQVFATTVLTGTAAADLSLKVCPTSSSDPGTCASPTDSSTGITSVPGTGGGVVEFTGFTAAISAYATPWLVLSSPGAGSTHDATWRYFTNMSPWTLNGMPTSGVKTTTNGGSSWSASAGSVMPYRVQCTNGNYYGYPYNSLITSAVPAATKIFGNQVYGPTFTMPANASVNISAVAFYVAKVSGPTGSLQALIYSDNGSTASIVSGGTSANSYTAASITTTLTPAVFYFSPAVTVTGGTKYHVVINDTAADSSTNYYFAELLTIDSGSPSLGIMPFNGTLTAAGCTGTCGASSNWTTAYDIPIHSLFFQPGTEFNSTGTGGQNSSPILAGIWRLLHPLHQGADQAAGGTTLGLLLAAGIFKAIRG